MKFENAIDYVGDNHGPSQGALVNIIFRFILNLGAAMACWIPMNLFHKNGEFAGTAMIIAIAVLNFFYAINAVVWPNNDIASWTKGYGWCDIQLILWVPLETLNAAAVCAVMQNIADQVAIVRASGLTGQERRRKHIIQAFIILPVPMLQIILYYFVIAMRYNISGIIGCQAVFDPDWVFLVFFILPCPMFAISAAYFAGKLKRFSLFFSVFKISNSPLRQPSLGGATDKSTQFHEGRCGVLVIMALKPGTQRRGGDFTLWR